MVLNSEFPNVMFFVVSSSTNSSFFKVVLHMHKLMYPVKVESIATFIFMLWGLNFFDLASNIFKL